MTTTTTQTRRLMRPAAQDPKWRDFASCREVDPDLFFPTGNGIVMAQQTDQAKRVCDGCPARSSCLEWALDTGQNSGVWGGLSENERRQMARTRFSHIDVCRENRELIEQRIAANASLRDIGTELGVGHWAVKRAVAEFRAKASEEVSTA